MRKISILMVLIFYSFGTKTIVSYQYFNPNLSFYSKDAMMAGATTATTKGYNSLYTNPAGLGSNPFFGIYLKTIANYTKSSNIDDNLVTIDSYPSWSFDEFGLIYRWIALDYNAYKYAGGFGYGYANKYGLFSFGASYNYDDIDTSSSNDYAYKISQATGNFYVLGFQYQKSFIAPDSFWAIYFGSSYKSSGKNNTQNAKIVVLSPKIFSVGLGAETNIYSKNY